MKVPQFSAFLVLWLILLVPNSFARGLEISEIRITVEYSQPYAYQLPYTSLRDRDLIDTFVTSTNETQRINADVFPGSNITFTVFVQNNAPAGSSEIRNTFATISIEEIDDGADLFAESDEFVLERGEEERIDIKFELPLAVKDELYDILIEVEGKDRNDTRYDATVNLKLDVRKKPNDVRIANVSLSPQIISCDRKTTLTAQIINLGLRDEDEVAIEFKNSALGINSVTQDILLKNFAEVTKDVTSYTKTLDIELPSFFKSGTYPILVNLYWKNFILFDQEVVDLVVMDCGAAPETEAGQTMPEKEKEVSIIQPEGKTEEKPEEKFGDGEVTVTTEKPFLDSQTLFLMIFGFSFVMIILIALIILAYLKIYK